MRVRKTHIRIALLPTDQAFLQSKNCTHLDHYGKNPNHYDRQYIAPQIPRPIELAERTYN